MYRNDKESRGSIKKVKDAERKYRNNKESSGSIKKVQNKANTGRIKRVQVG